MKKYMLKKAAALGALLSAFALAAAMPAKADDGNKNADLNVTLKITPGCSIGFGGTGNGEPGKVDLGPFINLDKDVTGDTILNVKCTKDSGINYKVGISAGQNTADYQNRQLKSDKGDMIAYNIYQDSAHQSKWGPIGSNDVVPADKFTKGEQMDAHPVYVLVPAQAGIALHAGTYTDRVVATVDYAAPSQ